VVTAIQSLPRHEREVVALFYISEYSHAEIGGFLGLPVSTIKSRLHTARRRLHERMLAHVGSEVKRWGFWEGKALPKPLRLHESDTFTCKPT
jgi:hypothetical protein